MNRILEIEHVKAKLVHRDSLPQEHPDGKCRAVAFKVLQGRSGLPAHIFAQIMLALPPDSRLVGIEQMDYNRSIRMAFESSEFPVMERGEFEVPEGTIRLIRTQDANGDLYLDTVESVTWPRP